MASDAAEGPSTMAFTRDASAKLYDMKYGGTFTCARTNPVGGALRVG